MVVNWYAESHTMAAAASNPGIANLYNTGTKIARVAVEADANHDFPTALQLYVCSFVRS